VILKDGAIVQQGEPQQILLHPNDPYIEDFVRDINRARVLRVRSVMRPCRDGVAFTGTTGPDATLEDLISLSGGDSGAVYRVEDDSGPVGMLDMKDLLRALVPSRPGESVGENGAA